MYRCNGDEKSLDECESVSGSGLGHERDVGVECRQPTPCSTPMVGNMITALHVSVLNIQFEYVAYSGMSLLIISLLTAVLIDVCLYVCVCVCM